MKPKLVTLYRCPKCEWLLESHIINAFNINNFEDWVCSKCKRKFRLRFKEIKK